MSSNRDNIKRKVSWGHVHSSLNPLFLFWKPTASFSLNILSQLCLHLKCWRLFASPGDIFSQRETSRFVFLSLVFQRLHYQRGGKNNNNKAKLNEAVGAAWTQTELSPWDFWGRRQKVFPSGPPCLPLMTSGLHISWLPLLPVGQTAWLTKPHSLIMGGTNCLLRHEA